MVLKTREGAKMRGFTVTYFRILPDGIQSTLEEMPVCGVVP